MYRRARSIRSDDPATTAPSGQPSPFEKQIVTVSASPAIEAGCSPLATAALKIREPSRWSESSSSRHVAAMAAISANGHTRPPEALCVFSIDDDPRRRHMPEVAAPGRGSNLLRCEAPGPRLKRARHQARVHCRPTELGNQDVRVLLGDQLVAGLAEHTERDLIRHRRGRHEDRVLLSQRLCGAALELVDGRVLAQLLVADLGARDRLAHGGSRLARRIGAEVDHDLILAAQVVGVPEKLG